MALVFYRLNSAIERGTKPGCLENFSGHRGGYRFQMHPIPEMLNPPGEPIYCVVSSSFIKIVGPSFVVGFLAREHVKDTAHDRMCHRDNRPILPTPCREALIQRREIRPLGPYGGMGELGQNGAQGPIPLAGFAQFIAVCSRSKTPQPKATALAQEV